MKKLLSAATSLCMAASLLSVLPATVSAADSTKALTIGAYAQSGSAYASQGSNVIISADDIAAGDVKVPCAVYLSEGTADCETLAIPITINSSNSDVKNVKFDLIDPTKPYFSENKTVTSAKGETLTTKNAIVFAAGLDEMGDYAPTGITNLTIAENQESAGAKNYYIGYGQTFPRGYSWTGSKSDDYPVFVFDVTFPKGTSAGDYTIDFCNYEKDAKKNPALLLEAESGRYANLNDLSNLKLNPMKITVGGGNTQPSTGDIVLDFGSYTANAGEKVNVEVKLKSGADKEVGSYDVKFKLDAPLELTAFGSSSAAYGGAAVESNKETCQASFICLDQNSDPLKGTEGENVFKFAVTIPSGTPDGIYNIGIASAEIFKGGKNSDMWTYSTVGGTIKVGNGSSTTSTTSTTTTTTTPIGDSDIVLDFGTYDNVKPGDKVNVNVILKSGADKEVGSYDVKFKLDAPLELTAFGSSSAAYGGAAVESNKETCQASFICLDQNSDPLKGTEGENVFKFAVTIPSGTPDGIYNIGIASAEIFKGGKNSDMWTYSTVNGIINVTGGAKPMIGDLNRDGKVDARDASLTLAFVADITNDPSKVTDTDMWVDDVNRDGKITPVDASIILRYYADLQADFTGSFTDYLVQVIKVDSSKLQ